MIYSFRGPFYSQDGGTGGGNPAPAPAPTPAPTGPQPVPYERFQSVVTDKNALAQQVQTLQQQIQALSEKAATVDTLATQLNEWKGKHAEAESRFATFTEFSSALGSTDNDVIGVFDSKWRALPEKDRPARADWVKSLREKPDDAPVLLRPFLGTTQAQPAKPGQPAPRIPGQPATPTTPAQQVSAEQWRAAREKGQSTGDWSEHKALMKAAYPGR